MEFTNYFELEQYYVRESVKFSERSALKDDKDLNVLLKYGTLVSEVLIYLFILHVLHTMIIAFCVQYHNNNRSK